MAIISVDITQYESMMSIYFVPARHLFFDFDSWWCAELTVLPQHLETLLFPNIFQSKFHIILHPKEYCILLFLLVL